MKSVANFWSVLKSIPNSIAFTFRSQRAFTLASNEEYRRAYENFRQAEKLTGFLLPKQALLKLFLLYKMGEFEKAYEEACEVERNICSSSSRYLNCDEKEYLRRFSVTIMWSCGVRLGMPVEELPSLAFKTSDLNERRVNPVIKKDFPLINPSDFLDEGGK
ncbi:MAG: hypothetical protein U5L08_16575 [Xanthomonadales bacterium]|nr:hypothetical protein [Xanthomonadales bacterium]